MAHNGGNGEQVNTHIVTLTRFLNEEQTKHKEASGDFTYVRHPRWKLFLNIVSLVMMRAAHTSFN